MTTQPKRKRKPKLNPNDERDPILDAADDVAQLFRSQDDDTDDQQTETEEEELQPLDDPSWEESLRIRYGDKTDEEIVAFAQNGDSVALEYLLGKYKNFVRSKARSYFLIGADHEDIVQEGMIGLFKAIRDYQAERLSSFRAFAELCITRQIITAIKTATRQKHVPLNSYVSLNKPIYDEESDRTLMDVIVECHAQNPEELIIGREDIMSIRDRVDEVLSSLEQEVLSAYLDGKSYQEIADKLGRHVKSIDNALQRVKRKLEKFVEESKAHDDD
ncbi:MAG: RNA polymerase sporulation sigma factor SigH [Eubacteriales bacterium]|nr:RNA polymerase sporulation sigma factor SigH [Eubacteriales bacterium]